MVKVMMQSRWVNCCPSVLAAALKQSTRLFFRLSHRARIPHDIGRCTWVAAAKLSPRELSAVHLVWQRARSGTVDSGTQRLVCALAAANSLETLVFAREKLHFQWSAETCQLAAQRGRLDCLMYAHQSGCPWNAETMRAENDWACLRFANARGCPWHAAHETFSVLRALIYS